VKLFGFSEYSLRLFPLVCGIASLFVFRHLASRLLAGVPLILAVACLAVAKAPQGLSANFKPYAPDPLLATLLLALRLQGLRRPEKARWLWALAAAIPLSLFLSYPAIFVASPVSAGLLLPVCRLRSSRIWLPYLALNAGLIGSFAGVLLLSSGPAAETTRA